MTPTLSTLMWSSFALGALAGTAAVLCLTQARRYIDERTTRNARLSLDDALTAVFFGLASDPYGYHPPADVRNVLDNAIGNACLQSSIGQYHDGVSWRIGLMQWLQIMRQTAAAQQRAAKAER